MKRFSAAALAFFLILASIANATTYSNRTVAQLNANSDNLQPDDIIVLAAGTYTTPVVIPVSGTSGHPITYTMTAAILNGNGTPTIGINCNGKEWVTIALPEITGFRAGAVDCTGTGLAGHVISGGNIHDNCVLQSGNFAVGLQGNTSPTVSGTTITNESVIQGLVRLTNSTGATASNLNISLIEGDAFNATGATNATISGCKISTRVDNGLGQHSDAIIAETYNGLTVKNCEIIDFTQGVYLGPIGSASGTAANLFVTGNVFHCNHYGTNNPGDGMPPIFMDATNSPTYIISGFYVVGNTFGNTGQPGRVYKGGGSTTNIVFENNLFKETRSVNGHDRLALDLTAVSGTSGFLSSYNSFYLCLPDSYETHTITSNPLVVADPGFGSDGPYNFAPQSGSPLINAGDPALAATISTASSGAVTIPNPWLDRNGTTRSRTTNTTIGAYDLAFTPPATLTAVWPGAGVDAAANIQASVNLAVAGDTVTIPAAAGSWTIAHASGGTTPTPAITFKSGSAGNPITYVIDGALIAKSGDYAGTRDSMFHIDKKSYVNIRGAGSVSMAGATGGSSTQQKTAFLIRGSDHINIDGSGGLTIKDSTGDNMQIGPTEADLDANWTPCSDITFTNLKVQGAGYNNLSVLSVDRFTARGCTFSGAAGNSPQAGVDIEPGSNGSTDKLDHLTGILFEDCVAYDNVNRDFDVVLNRHSARNPPVDIVVRRWRSKRGTAHDQATAGVNLVYNSIDASCGSDAPCLGNAALKQPTGTIRFESMNVDKLNSPAIAIDWIVSCPLNIKLDGKINGPASSSSFPITMNFAGSPGSGVINFNDLNLIETTNRSAISVASSGGPATNVRGRILSNMNASTPGNTVKALVPHLDVLKPPHGPGI